MVQDVDKDDSGVLDFDEFCCLMEKLTASGSFADDLEEMFKAYHISIPLDNIILIMPKSRL